MKILFIIPYAPTLIRTRPYNLLRALARCNHRLTLATVWEKPEEREGLERLARETGVRLMAFPLKRAHSVMGMSGALLKNTPLQSAYSWQPHLAQALRDELRLNRYDAVHTEHLRGAPYGLFLKEEIARLGSSVPVVYDSVDSISLLYGRAAQHTRSLIWRWIIRFELPRTRRYEAHLVHRFDRVLVTSPLDRGALLELAYHPNQNNSRETEIEEKIDVLPNGVDLEYFFPGPGDRQPDQIVFSGKMSYHANTSAAMFLVNEVMPHVWAQRPRAQVILVGKSPPGYLQKLAVGNSNVRVTGSVPDIRPYLQKATLAAAPITYGAGIQNKVLEAMACGIPVAATPTAISALSAIPNQEVLIGENARELAGAILCLLESDELRRRIGANGRTYVENSHNWDKIANRLELAYLSGRN